MNGLYEGRVSIVERQGAVAVKRRNISLNILLASHLFDSSSLLHFLLSITLSISSHYPLFPSSAGCDWSLTQTLGAL